MARPGSSALGGIIRQQRDLAALLMRQLATMVGISNPYLTQIERGTAQASEEVLDALARDSDIDVDQRAVLRVLQRAAVKANVNKRRLRWGVG